MFLEEALLPNLSKSYFFFIASFILFCLPYMHIICMDLQAVFVDRHGNKLFNLNNINIKLSQLS
jgi:hypothetical protein